MVFVLAMKITGLHCLLCLSIGLLIAPLPGDGLKVKLVGPSRCSGRIEVFYQDHWGTVCDDHWGSTNAEVACRELNCGTALAAKRRAFFGEGKERIWLDDVECTGSESSLLDCRHRGLGDNDCSHGEDAGVICSENVLLVNGTNRCSGRVQVHHDGHWRKVCNTDWDREAGEVLCRELDCGVPFIGHDMPNFGHGSGEVGIKTQCLGNESSLAHCTLQELKQPCVDATVFCANNQLARLVNGTNRCSGRVEVFHNSQWGTICDDSWGMQEAEVVCRQMNCGTALMVKYRSFFGEGEDPVWMDDIQCSGSEKSLTDCPHRGFGENDCGHIEDAGVICSEKVKLANGTNRCNGRLEVFHDGQWGKMCHSNWNANKAAMVCKELNCGIPEQNPVNLNFGEAKGLRGYTGRCRGSEDSIADCSLQVHSGTCDDVVLSCLGQPLLKLVNGTDDCSGRVEVQHDGQWGTVCDDEWDINDAQVVCREMGCGTAQIAKSGAFFGKGTGEIWLDDVNCLGNETTLNHCQHSTFGDNNCGHGEDAGVVCSNKIRLINGTDQCSGRIEIFHGGSWSTVYNVNWGLNEAQVLCREMNCGDPVTPPASSQLGQSGMLRGLTIRCRGSETSVTQCSIREYVKTSQDHAADATVFCSGNVKLVNGSNKCSGRVEYYHNGQWGTICGDSWDADDATVLCKQLNCGSANRITKMDHFGYGKGKLWIDEIQCNGRESSLSQCTQREFGEQTCNGTSVAGVFCSDGLPVRLVGTGQCFGRLELQHENKWGTVCDKDLNMKKAEVVCKQLDCGSVVSISSAAHYGVGTGPVWEASESCFSSEDSLQQCSLNGFNSTSCGHEQDVGIICAEKIRLANGRSQCSGRVEVYHKGQWGTVCDDEWEVANAEVVCRQLGCGEAISFFGNAHFGRGSGQIWLDNVECTGQEVALTQCSHNAFGENNCGHGEDAGVICLGNLPKPQITLSPATDVGLGDRVEFTCTMVTEHLGGTFILQKNSDSFKMEKYSDNDAAMFIIRKVELSHTGSYHCKYRKRLTNKNIDFPEGDSAKLTVTMHLEQPSISLTSPSAMVMFRPDKVELKSGSSFSITCSVHSKYQGGFFYLVKANLSTSEPKPAFGHSIFLLAYFEFPSVMPKDQGEYSCIYGINISAVLYKSIPSKSLQVILTGSSSGSAITGAVVGLLLLVLLLLAAYFFWRRRGQSARAMVTFSSRVGEVIKQDKEEKTTGAHDGRDYNTLANEYGNGHSPEEKGAEVDPQSTLERNVTEDLSGRVCYELEPLIHS